MKKTLKQMINNKGKNRQIEIDEKPPDPVGTEEENRSVGGAGYCVFAFLFGVLVIAGRPRFRLVALEGLPLGRGTVSRAIGGEVSTRKEVAVSLLGLSLWKVPISCRRCCTADAGS